jgi:hypothetical protein
MTIFATPADVDFLVGGALRWAAANPVVSAQLADASVTVGIVCREPAARIVIEMYSPVRVRWNDSTLAADIELFCRADVLDRCMRGEERLVDVLATGQVVAKGRVSMLLKVMPALEQAFPVYRELVTAARVGDLLAAPRS